MAQSPLTAAVDGDVRATRLPERNANSDHPHLSEGIPRYWEAKVLADINGTHS
ncbi:MAG: hypothetical protein ABWY20_08660 [Mycobacterium sp.]